METCRWTWKSISTIEPGLNPENNPDPDSSRRIPETARKNIPEMTSESVGGRLQTRRPEAEKMWQRSFSRTCVEIAGVALKYPGSRRNF